MIKKTIEVESRTGIILRKKSFKKGTVSVLEINGNEFYRFQSGLFIKELTIKEYEYLIGLAKKENPIKVEKKEDTEEARDVESESEKVKESKPKKKGRPKKGDE